VNVPSDSSGSSDAASLEHSASADLTAGNDSAYATLKKAAANANQAGRRLNDEQYKLNRQNLRRNSCRPACDMFPPARLDDRQRHAFNMKVNEVFPTVVVTRRHTPGQQTSDVRTAKSTIRPQLEYGRGRFNVVEQPTVLILG